MQQTRRHPRPLHTATLGLQQQLQPTLDQRPQPKIIWGYHRLFCAKFLILQPSEDQMACRLRCDPSLHVVKLRGSSARASVRAYRVLYDQPCMYAAVSLNNPTPLSLNPTNVIVGDL